MKTPDKIFKNFYKLAVLLVIAASQNILSKIPNE
jgi:hypothetical protein|tara:strand:- start:455 stop:556 length:102 start_codon:yes stop_codon:yes gene_type:complete